MYGCQFKTDDYTFRNFGFRKNEGEIHRYADFEKYIFFSFESELSLAKQIIG